MNAPRKKVGKWTYAPCVIAALHHEMEKDIGPWGEEREEATLGERRKRKMVPLRSPGT